MCEFCVGFFILKFNSSWKISYVGLLCNIYYFNIQCQLKANPRANMWHILFDIIKNISRRNFNFLHQDSLKKFVSGHLKPLINLFSIILVRPITHEMGIDMANLKPLKGFSNCLNMFQSGHKRPSKEVLQ